MPFKKLQESKGNATLGELFDYISQNVKRITLSTTFLHPFQSAKTPPQFLQLCDGQQYTE